MEPTCRDCAHVRSHYIKLGRGYRRIECGHCVYPRLKSRRASNPACQRFEEKETSKDM